ncbi:MAG: recombination protein NinG [Sediminibacterium sp.]
MTPYHFQLQKIRNKQVPSASQANHLQRGKIVKTKSIGQLSYQLLLVKAQVVFNAWIRKRDRDKGCVSCKSLKVVHASHYYAAGSFGALRFKECNANGSCANCNKFLYGNLEAYRKELALRIGSKALLEMDRIATENKRKKYSRLELMEIIAKYQ